MTDSTTALAEAADETAVDGGHAAPLCMTDPGNPACARRMIAVDRLTVHPGNVREDLDLTPEFCASIAANGVRVPLLITITSGDGGFRVIEGHRRLAAAVKAGLAEVPYDLDGDRATDEAGQFLDMVTANSGAYRKNFTPLEEATALFAAHEAGATKTRIRKATGRKADQVKTALAAGSLLMSTREQVAGLDLDEQLTLDELAILAEFEDDPDAMEELMRAIRYNYPLEHAAERIRLNNAEAADHERIKAELEAAGCTITDQIVPGSMLLTSLAHDGEDLTEETHKDCPGHAAFFRSHDRRTPVFYCTDPGAHGHVSRWAQPTPATPTASGDPRQADHIPDAPSLGQPGGSPTEGAVPQPTPDPEVERARRLVAEGNTAWAAAAEVRKRWVQQLLWRRTAPKEILRFVARQLFDLPDALRRGLPAAPGRTVFLELTGKPLEAVLRACDTSPAARMPLLALAPIAIAYESEMAGEGERRNTWRTDAWAPCSRKDAAMWLKFLAGLGYELSAIEQAVADGVPYTGDDTPGEPGTGPDGDGVPLDAASADLAEPSPGGADDTGDANTAGNADAPGEYPGDAAA
jgi:ParB family chromosome partitioning protein